MLSAYLKYFMVKALHKTSVQDDSWMSDSWSNLPNEVRKTVKKYYERNQHDLKIDRPEGPLIIAIRKRTSISTSPAKKMTTASLKRSRSLFLNGVAASCTQTKTIDCKVNFILGSRKSAQFSVQFPPSVKTFIAAFGKLFQEAEVYFFFAGTQRHNLFFLWHREVADQARSANILALFSAIDPDSSCKCCIRGKTTTGGPAAYSQHCI